MSSDDLLDVVPSGWMLARDIPIDGGGRFRVLVYHDDLYRFEHVCRTGGGDPVRNAPRLDRHHVAVGETVTVHPSVVCECGLHGWIIDGRWRNAGGVDPASRSLP